ncbi:MAG: AAA family ATPase, partial [Gemmatimonadota bacterium]|nr:AAA family ATPase [Gemmatimonadota bacterium]
MIHGRRFVLPQGNRRPAEGEVDFLVLDPKRGIVGLEVKGGHVGRDHDGWYRDAPGGRKRIKDPGTQAQSAIHNLGHYIRDGDPALSRRGWGWGVVLPDVDVDGDLGADLPGRLVTDRGDLSDPTAAVGRAFDHFNVDGPALDDAGVRAFRNVVLPRFRLVPSMKPVRIGPKTLAERIEADEAELVRLTDDQMRVLDFNGGMTRLAVEGGAGTGKTLVAVEQARRLAADGARVLVLCFNRGLAEGLADDLRDIEEIDVFSFHGLCHARAIAAGLGWPSMRDADSEFWETTAAELLLQALEANPGDRYDAVLVDEGQDFADHWWIPVQALLRDPGDGALWVFHDPPQNIFGREGWSDIAALPSARLG